MPIPYLILECTFCLNVCDQLYKAHWYVFPKSGGKPIP